MKMMIPMSIAGLVFLLGVGGCSCCKHDTSPATAVSGTVAENVVSATAKVKAVDQKTRHVTLERSDGTTATVVAGDDVRNLAQVKVGDEVTVTYYESLAYEVRKASGGTPGASLSASAARAPVGEKPAGLVGQALTVTATISAIDKTTPSVTLRGPEGDSKTFKVRDRNKLEQVKIGDLVDLTYTEAVAISVDTPAKK